jgi:hypothetical protein
MGKWLAALRTSEKKSENATDANPQNHQNQSERGGRGFDGFEGSPPEAFPIFQPDGNGWDEEDWQVAFDERAAILEYDEGLSRPAAARLARQQIDQQRRGKWH